MNEPVIQNGSPAPMQSTSRSLSSGRRVYAAAALAVMMVVLGFVAGYGYGFGKNRQIDTPPLPIDGKPAALAPVVKAMRLSPDGRRLAFTGVYDQSRRSSRFLIDLGSRAWGAQESPSGWQDYITQWSPDGERVLFEREKIPRPVAEAKPGIYEEEIEVPQRPTANTGNKPSSQFRWMGPESLSADLSLKNEKIITGFWDTRGGLVLKTRREPKALYRVEAGRASRVDATPGTYLQNRAVREKGRNVLYVVRTVEPNASASAATAGQGAASGTQSTSATPGMALYRIDGAKTQRLSEEMQDVVWVYVSEDGHWMLSSRYAEDGENWQWSLYRISATQAVKVREAQIPGDVISVYWSPDRRYVLGSSGGSLWVIDVPSLKVRRLGT
ncbi:MAG: hypothetical protein JWN98_1117, partial [Abditibacteriota bacterium]|nr:hypothetical protein [Abditibacteriota bacterium]